MAFGYALANVCNLTILMPEEIPQLNPENGVEPNFESSKSHAKQAAEQFRSAAEAKARDLREKAEAKAQEFRSAAEEKYQEIRHKAESKYEEARARARTLQEDGEAYIKENPLKAVGTALVAGFMVGLLMRR